MPMIGVFQRWDEILFRLVNRSCANPVGDAFFPLFNHAAPLLLPALVLTAWLAWRNSPRAWKWALALVLGIALGDSLVFNPLKKAIGRPRPAATLKEVRTLAPGATGGWSLPSSHTANAFLAATMLAAAVPRRRAFWFSLAGVVGLARVYVGVHYPFDVVASALLGWGVGKGFILGGGRLLGQWRSRGPHKESPSLSGVGAAASGDLYGPRPWILRLATPLLLLALAAIQVSRLLWAATTDLDIPVAAARIWCDVHSSSHATLGEWWFRIFGSSSLSLWAIPWTLQTLWLFALAGILFRQSRKQAVASLLLLAVTVPLVSQLSFLGNPALAFQGSDWPASDPTRALVFYGLLGLPLWAAALFGFRRHPFASGFAFVGLLLGTSFPWMPWFVVALLTSGIVLQLARRLGKWIGRLGSPEARHVRLGLTLLVGYGLLISACVYQPRLLRKLDLSLLPRNSPYYGQTGWAEYVRRVHPHLHTRPHATIWTDSRESALMVRYQLQNPRGQRARSMSDGVPASWIRPGDLYLREVYLAQINPRVIFFARNDWLHKQWAGRLRELDSVEIFRKGDPIRQFQLWEFTAEPAKPAR
ncbi:MAG: phosphatase PAP2 family protein [Verrucomicrobiia bacterium]